MPPWGFSTMGSPIFINDHTKERISTMKERRSETQMLVGLAMNYKESISELKPTAEYKLIQE